MAVAGWNCCLEEVGDAQTVAGGGMTLVSGKTYRVTTAAHDVWDPTVAIVVYDNAVPVSAANIASIDFLFGRVTFDAGYTVTGPVTVDYDYLPRLTIDEAFEFSMNPSRAMLSDNRFCFDYNMRVAGLKDISGSFSVRDDGTKDNDDGGGSSILRTKQENGSLVFLTFTIEQDAGTPIYYRILARLESAEGSADTQDQIITTFNYTGTGITQNGNAVTYSSLNR